MVICGVVIDSNSHFTCQSDSVNDIVVISGLLVGAECGLSAAVAPWCLSACGLTYHRRVCLIDTYTTHFCSLALHRSMSNYPFDAHNACSNKTRNCTSQSVHPDYPYCALACMLLYVCNNYGPMVYLVVFLHYVPCALSTLHPPRTPTNTWIS